MKVLCIECNEIGEFPNIKGNQLKEGDLISYVCRKCKPKVKLKRELRI